MGDEGAVEDDWDNHEVEEGAEQYLENQQIMQVQQLDENGNLQQQDDDLNLGGEDEDGMGQAHADLVAAQEEDVLLMRFCPHDSSMLYPAEDKRGRALRYACRLCQYSEISASPLIYRNRLKREVTNTLHTVPSAVSDDPTLPRSHNANCASCGHNEAVFFQSDSSFLGSDSLALIFVCSNCSHKWVA